MPMIIALASLAIAGISSVATLVSSTKQVENTTSSMAANISGLILVGVGAYVIVHYMRKGR